MSGASITESQMATRSFTLVRDKWGRVATTTGPLAPDQVARVPAHRGQYSRAAGVPLARRLLPRGGTVVTAEIQVPAEAAVSALMEATDEFEAIVSALPPGHPEAQHLAARVTFWSRECDRLEASDHEAVSV